jgi:metal-responsive CopG/Arc/MetJ family transcriptional regulator
VARVQISVGLDSSLLDKIDDLADNERRSRGNMIGQLLREAMDRRAELGKIITRGNGEWT